jgi:hypothetical protein
MYGNLFSKNGKKLSGGKMTSTALIEAKGWAEALMQREFSGRGDREKSARYRLSKKTGVPESYLFRLQYKTREMKDVAGEVYRRLRLHYDAACLANEEAADRYRSERLGMTNNEPTNQKPASAVLGMVAPNDGKAVSEKA